jgi:hypothetical protein
LKKRRKQDTGATKSSYVTSQPLPVSNAVFPFLVDGSGTPEAHAAIDLQGPNNQWTTFDFEFDTGAFISILPASAGALLGVNVQQGVAWNLSGVDGTPFTIYVHTLVARFHGSTSLWNLQIGFATVETPILLGRYGFWVTRQGILLSMTNKATVFQPG